MPLEPHAREIIASSALVLEVAPPVTASAHQVHETAWVLVVRGEAEVAAADGDGLVAALDC